MTPYSLVIATYERPQPLSEAFASIAEQTCAPVEVIVVDSSGDEHTRVLCASWAHRLPVRWVRAQVPSAARQRNQGAALVTTPLVGFMDDDVVLRPDTLEKLVCPFSEPVVGGMAGRILEMSHPVPKGLLWWYYRLQAGYSHPHYGGHVIGPAINLLPAFEAESAHLVRSDWLNSTLVLYRRELFEREQFPNFEGYSFLEDAHLSYRIGQTHELYFHRDAVYEHNSRPSAAKSDRRKLSRMIVRHQRRMGRDVLGIGALELGWKLTLHRLFQSIAVLRQGQPDRWRAIRGFWEFHND